MRERANEDGSGELVEGTMLGKYRVVRAIGAGAMGAVYVGMHKDNGDRVAIKVLDRRLANLRQARERFRLEAQIAKRVRHPHIVDVFEAGDAGRNTYLVMELLTGEDLAQRLESAGPLPAQEVADILIPICGAIAAAHQADVTHRDLKPLNIFLAAGNPVRPKVLDFGISIAKGIELPVSTIPGAPKATSAAIDAGLVGSPCYLAPEQVANSGAAGPASDQYALGVIAYECLTGQRPFDGDNLEGVLQAIAAGEPQRPSVLQPDVPAGLEAVVLRALRRDPARRFASVNDLGRALLPFASEKLRSSWAETFGAAAQVEEPAEVAAPEADAGAKVPVTLDALIAAAAAAAAATTTVGVRPESSAEPRLGLGAPRVRTLSSPAIEVEAATRSPFVQTLPPQAPELSEVSEPLRAPPLLIGLPGGLYDDPGEVILTGGFFRTRVAPLLARVGPVAVAVSTNKWARIGGGAAIAMVVVLLFATGGSAPSPTPAKVVPTSVSVATPAPAPAPKVVPPAPPPANVPPLPPKPAPVAAAVALPAAAPPPAAPPASAAPPREAPPPAAAAPAPTTAAARPIGGHVDDGTERSPSRGEPRPPRGSSAESKRRVPLLD